MEIFEIFLCLILGVFALVAPDHYFKSKLISAKDSWLHINSGFSNWVCFENI